MRWHILAGKEFRQEKVLIIEIAEFLSGYPEFVPFVKKRKNFSELS